jgi:hypothetical protein
VWCNLKIFASKRLYSEVDKLNRVAGEHPEVKLVIEAALFENLRHLVAGILKAHIRAVKGRHLFVRFQQFADAPASYSAPQDMGVEHQPLPRVHLRLPVRHRLKSSMISSSWMPWAASICCRCAAASFNAARSVSERNEPSTLN